MTHTQKYIAVPTLAALLLVGGAIGGYASLTSAEAAGGRMEQGFGKGVHGAIASISGTTIVVTSSDGTNYTVDASNAQVKSFVEGQGPSTGALTHLAVGDVIGVHGEVSGTNVTADTIMDGMPPHGPGGFGRHGKGLGVMGTVSAVSGSTITVTGRDGTSYTVDASSAGVQRMIAGSLGDINVGDRIGVHGDVSGTNVSAKMIMDDLPEAPIQNQ